MYCQKCGGKLESYASNCAFCGTPVQKYDASMKYVVEEKNVAKKEHMSAWKWIGFYLLPLIVLVGSIIQIVLIFKWAFGKHDDLSLKGYARAKLLIVLFAFILFVVGVVLVLLMPGQFDDLLKKWQ